MVNLKRTAEYILGRVREDGRCWIWQQRNGDCPGYGRVWLSGRLVLAHRLSYEVFYDIRLSDEEVVRHSCDRPPCVNPNHLTRGTMLDNSRDALARQRLDTRLTWDDVYRIRAMSFAEITPMDISRMFGVGYSTVADIIQNNTWREEYEG